MAWLGARSHRGHCEQAVLHKVAQHAREIFIVDNVLLQLVGGLPLAMSSAVLFW